MKLTDLSGQTFGNLTVLYRTDNHYYSNGRHDIVYRCKCICGNEINALGVHLRAGHTKSCGCFRCENTSKMRKTHGMTNTRLYFIWKGMKGRCADSNRPDYQLYGGRGIAVCDEWENSFECFMKWAVDSGYDDHLSIDRIDVNGNYTPSNCRWVTQKAQCNNTRRNVFIEFNGEVHTMKQWAEILNINYEKLQNRMKRGWPFDKAISL